MNARHTFFSSFTRVLALSVLAAVSTACLGGGGGGGGGGAVASGPNFNQGLAAFQAVQDPAEEQAVFEDIWRFLTAPSCWDGAYSIRVSDTPIGSVAQYSFYDPFNYRYVGGGASGVSDIWSGQMGYYAVGYYGGLPAMVHTTWMDQPELIVMMGNGILAHVWWTDSGYPVALYFNASERCQ
ncbi:MAG: hypothetical protein RL885_26470 [Planctomycetota bacterium]